MSDNSQELPNWSWWGTIGGLFAAQLCCGLPWLLVSIGITGGVITQLEALRPFRPFFIGASLIFFILGWIQLRRQRTCPLKRS